MERGAVAFSEPSIPPGSRPGFWTCARAARPTPRPDVGLRADRRCAGIVGAWAAPTQPAGERALRGQAPPPVRGAPDGDVINCRPSGW